MSTLVKHVILGKPDGSGGYETGYSELNEVKYNGTTVFQKGYKNLAETQILASNDSNKVDITFHCTSFRYNDNYSYEPGENENSYSNKISYLNNEKIYFTYKAFGYNYSMSDTEVNNHFNYEISRKLNLDYYGSGNWIETEYTTHCYGNTIDDLYFLGTSSNKRSYLAIIYNNKKISMFPTHIYIDKNFSYETNLSESYLTGAGSIGSFKDLYYSTEYNGYFCYSKNFNEYFITSYGWYIDNTDSDVEVYIRNIVDSIEINGKSFTPSEIYDYLSFNYSNGLNNIYFYLKISSDKSLIYC